MSESDAASEASASPSGSSATLYCPNCGTAFPVGARFCSSCGKALPDMADVQAPPPPPGSERPASTAYKVAPVAAQAVQAAQPAAPTAARSIGAARATTAVKSKDSMGMNILVLIVALFGELTSSVYRIAVVILVIVGAAALINSCAANATLNEHSSCQQFANASSSAQDGALQSMMTAHNDHSTISGARASVTLYCDLYGGNAPIDGIYSGGNIHQPITAARFVIAARRT